MSAQRVSLTQDAVHESFTTVVTAFTISRGILMAQYIISKASSYASGTLAQLSCVS
jgi:hypothetical protein